MNYSFYFCLLTFCVSFIKAEVEMTNYILDCTVQDKLYVIVVSAREIAEGRCFKIDHHTPLYRYELINELNNNIPENEYSAVKITQLNSTTFLLENSLGKAKHALYKLEVAQGIEISKALGVSDAVLNMCNITKYQVRFDDEFSFENLLNDDCFNKKPVVTPVVKNSAWYFTQKYGSILLAYYCGFSQWLEHWWQGLQEHLESQKL